MELGGHITVHRFSFLKMIKRHKLNKPLTFAQITVIQVTEIYQFLMSNRKPGMKKIKCTK